MRSGWLRGESRSFSVIKLFTELSHALGVTYTAAYRLVYEDIPVADLQIVATGGVTAYPGLVVDGRSLATEVRQGQKITVIAILALWKTVYFRHIKSLSYELELPTNITKMDGFGNNYLGLIICLVLVICPTFL